MADIIHEEVDPERERARVVLIQQAIDAENMQRLRDMLSCRTSSLPLLVPLGSFLLMGAVIWVGSTNPNWAENVADAVLLKVCPSAAAATPTICPPPPVCPAVIPNITINSYNPHWLLYVIAVLLVNLTLDNWPAKTLIVRPFRFCFDWTVVTTKRWWSDLIAYLSKPKKVNKPPRCSRYRDRNHCDTDSDSE